MNKEFVSFEIAKELKELGFDEECFAGYQLDGNVNRTMRLFYRSSSQRGITVHAPTYGKYSSQNKHIIKAPLISQVINWMREVHGIVVDVFQESNILKYTGRWKVDISNLGIFQEEEFPQPGIVRDDYLEALNSGILSAIEMIKNKYEDK